MHAGLGCSGRCNYGNDFADPYSIWIKGFRGRHEVVGQYFRDFVFPISSVYFSEKQEKAFIVHRVFQPSTTLLKRVFTS